jgi:hypothetical protein
MSRSYDAEIHGSAMRGFNDLIWSLLFLHYLLSFFY